MFDRKTGEPIYPIKEKKVPKYSLIGEFSWPTQPVPTIYPSFSRINLSDDDYPIRSKEAREYAKRVWESSK